MHGACATSTLNRFSQPVPARRRPVGLRSARAHRLDHRLGPPQPDRRPPDPRRQQRPQHRVVVRVVERARHRVDPGHRQPGQPRRPSAGGPGRSAPAARPRRRGAAATARAPRRTARTSHSCSRPHTVSTSVPPDTATRDASRSSFSGFATCVSSCTAATTANGPPSASTGPRSCASPAAKRALRHRARPPAPPPPGRRRRPSPAPRAPRRRGELARSRSRGRAASSRRRRPRRPAPRACSGRAHPAGPRSRLVGPGHSSCGRSAPDVVRHTDDQLAASRPARRSVSGCPRPSRRTRTAATGTADRAARTSPPRRCAA